MRTGESGTATDFTTAIGEAGVRLWHLLPHRGGWSVLVLSALKLGLAHARQVVGAVDQGHMRKGLGKVADQASGARIVFLTE